MRAFHVLSAMAMIILVCVVDAKSVFEDHNATANALTVPATSTRTPRILSEKTRTTGIDANESMDKNSRNNEERAGPFASLENAFKSSTSKIHGGTLKAKTYLSLKVNKRPDQLFTKLKLHKLDENQLLSSPAFLAWLKYVDAYKQKLKTYAVGANIYTVLTKQNLGELQLAKVFESLARLPGYEKIGTRLQDEQFSRWYWGQKRKPNDLWPHVKAEGQEDIMKSIRQRYAAHYNELEDARIAQERLENPATRYIWANKVKLD